MNFNIVDIMDRGIPNKERLVLKALVNFNLSYCLILNSRYISSSRISNSPKGSFWFSPKDVKAGDLVIVYSGVGVSSEVKNQDGSTSHFFYWGSSSTLWNDPNDCAVIFDVQTWQTTKYLS